MCFLRKWNKWEIGSILACLNISLTSVLIFCCLDVIKVSTNPLSVLGWHNEQKECQTTTLTKIINATLLFLHPFFMSWTQRSKTFSMYTKGLFLSNIVHKSVLICISEHFSFAEIIHPPHRCGISRCWLDSMIIAQVCLRLATIKGHSKMCSFTVLGGSENQSVSGVTTICLTQCNTSPSHRVDQVLIVACGMLVHSSSMAVRSCWILAGTGTRCRIRRSRASQTCSMGDMSGEYAGHARTGMFSASRNCVQILATWGRALSCCNMRWWSWMNGTTMGLRISSRYLCAFKMLSIKCTCVRCHNIRLPIP